MRQGNRHDRHSANPLAMKTIIIEDEAKSREMLRKMVEMFCPEVRIAGTADSVASAVSLIREVEPDIVLLDIELHPDKCFDIFPQLDSLDFEVIFTTAYKNYAIEAIKYGALDYLLKPIDMGELKTAIGKAIQKRSQSRENGLLRRFLQEFRAPGSARLALSTAEGIIYAEVAQISRCEAKGPYTNIYFRDGKKITTSKNLKEYELALSGQPFFRIHNSHLVNLAEVKKYMKADGGYVEMADGSQVPVSSANKEAFLERMRAML